MPENTDGRDFASGTQEQLDLARLAGNPGEKKRHLDRAAHFATLYERSRTPHRLPGDQTENKGVEGQWETGSLRGC